MSKEQVMWLNKALDAYVQYQRDLSAGMVYTEPLKELNEIIGGLINKMNEQQMYIEKLEKLIIQNAIKDI